MLHIHTSQVITNGLQPKRGHRHRIEDDILEGGGSEPEITLPDSCLVDLPDNTLFINYKADQADPLHRPTPVVAASLTTLPTEDSTGSHTDCCNTPTAATHQLVNQHQH